MRDYIAPVNYLKEISVQYGASIVFEDVPDKSFGNAEIKKEGYDLDVAIVIVKGQEYAYGVTSSSLPRELYSDSIPNERLHDRNKEILLNVRSILSKQIDFHPKASIFNAKKGYISIPIDGKVYKINQKENAFNLNTNS